VCVFVIITGEVLRGNYSDIIRKAQCLGESGNLYNIRVNESNVIDLTFSNVVITIQRSLVDFTMTKESVSCALPQQIGRLDDNPTIS
jgi:hypothetical protein